MHNPRFPRIRPLALSLLLACGAGAILPAVAGITCVVEHSEDGTQATGGANTGTEDDRTTACGNGAVATGGVRTAFGTNGKARAGPAGAMANVPQPQAGATMSTGGRLNASGSGPPAPERH